ncbi:heat stress transcription factor c-1b [Hordeum vulgare]|nr:heat stress transcription factor c-1b [Hordeum vulgare]
MGDCKADKRPLKPEDPEAERQREWDLREKAKWEQETRRAIPSEGFFCMEFEEEDGEEGYDLKAVNGAILSMDRCKLTLRMLKHELKHIVASDWDWQIS